MCRAKRIESAIVACGPAMYAEQDARKGGDDDYREPARTD